MTDKFSHPLFVDLDMSFIKTNALFEGVWNIFINKIYLIIFFPYWLAQGPAHFKRQIARHSSVNNASLPVNSEVLNYINDQAKKGRDIYLISGADESVVHDMASEHPVFKGGWGSDGKTNLSGKNKLDKIRSIVGDEFSYMGDSKLDIVVWEGASSALLVGDYANTVGSEKLENKTAIEKRFYLDKITLKEWIKALKVHHWIKNLLLFVPLILTKNDLDVPMLSALVLGFLAFGFMASGTYILNDIADLNNDRKHFQKKHRPLASGRIPLLTISFVGLGLLLGFILCLSFLPTNFLFVCLAYLITTISYTLWIKSLPILDILTLGGLYTLRVVAGVMLIGALPSIWLFAFTMFFFSSLAAAKRYIDVFGSKVEGNGTALGRGYDENDIPFVRLFGFTSGLSSIILLILYMALESHVETAGALWVVVFIIAYWELYIWRLVIRNEIEIDPVLFAIRDKVSLICTASVAMMTYASFVL